MKTNLKEKKARKLAEDKIRREQNNTLMHPPLAYIAGGIIFALAFLIIEPEKNIYRALATAIGFALTIYLIDLVFVNYKKHKLKNKK